MPGGNVAELAGRFVVQEGHPSLDLEARGVAANQFVIDPRFENAGAEGRKQAKEKGEDAFHRTVIFLRMRSWTPSLRTMSAVRVPDSVRGK